MKLLTSVFSAVRRKPLRYLVTALVLAAIPLALWARPKRATENLSYYEVKRGDVLISVVEGGTVEAVNDQVVRSEVEGTARIIYIVPEGATVKKGDLLVELDSSAAQDAVNLQQINVERAQFALLQAEQVLEIGRSTVESEVDAAELKLEFAQKDLEKYSKGEALQLTRNAQIEITNVLESLRIAEERLDWTRQLYSKGFETKGNLDKDELTVLQSRLKLEQATNALAMLETFDAPKKKRELEAALDEARQSLARVKLQGERKIAQMEGDVATQRSTLELSEAKLERDMRQLAATKIYAPQDGLVVYAGNSGGRFSSESMIEEGAVVRNRQELIKLPDISSMKLIVKIHESHVNQVTRGQHAFVVLDSMPDQRFGGVVSRVAPLPDSSSRWGNPNLKVYATEILITDTLPDIKPGVSARAEILITNLPNVVAVPLQAVTTRAGKQVVFVEGNPPTPVPVTVGQYNTKVIEILAGLKAGDRVLLAPPFDAEEKDLGGAVLASGETPMALDTNKVLRALNQAREPRNWDGEFSRGGRRGFGTNSMRGSGGGRRGGAGGGDERSPGNLSSQSATDALRKAIRADGPGPRSSLEGVPGGKVDVESRAEKRSSAGPRP